MGWLVTAMGYGKKENKQELKKHAATIHCSNTLSLLQRKITNALLYHAYPELMIKDEHQITIKQLCRLIGYQGNNHGAIKEALKGLISTVIEGNVIDDETEEEWTASSILASVSLKGPLCFYAYSPRMKQLLHSPSMFGKIDLVIQSQFRSSYGLALYENCIRYRGLPHTKWFDMDLFKKLMGVPSGQYDIFRDFRRRVLDKAIEEVNSYSDLVVTSEFIREGRKVCKLRFSLKERAKKRRLGNPKDIIPFSVSMEHGLQLTLFNNFGLSEEQIKKLLEEYDTSFIQEKITLLKASKPYLEGKIKNLSGYLMSAIKQNYQAPVFMKRDFAEEESERELKALEYQIEAIRQDYQFYREETINRAISSLKKQEKENFMQQFLQFAKPAIQTVLQLQRNKYTHENVLNSPQIQAQLRQFALRELDLLSICSIEEFVMSLSDEQKTAWRKLKSWNPDHPLFRAHE